MSGQQKRVKERRSSDRKTIELPGLLILDDGVEPCTIYDISPRGAKISACTRAPLDRPIRLKLTENGEFVGKVVWRKGDFMGLEFLHLSDDVAYAAEFKGASVRLVS